jgi:CubicO group peptidase (beta-lactamase class C family)
MKKLCCVALLMVFGYTGFSQAFSLMADSIRKYRGVPGLVYAVFNASEVLDMGASGMREFRKKDSIRLSDRFYIGTNTTAFTSYLAARLAETGKIGWSTSLIKAIPELNGKTMKLYHKVTLLQLLSQRSGIKPFAEPDDWNGFSLLAGSKMEQRRAFTTLVLKQPPLLVVDSSQATYSVAGTSIAAAMMEKITGKAWEELIAQYISKPLNIAVRFGLPKLSDSLQPSGHREAGNGLFADGGERTVPAIAPATDVNISLKDYIVFMQDLLKAISGKKAIISTSAANFLLFGFPHYAMGWENEVWKNLHTSQYLGKSPLFSSYTMIIKEKNIGIIVLCNSGTVSGKSAVLNFGRMLRDYYSRL